MYYLFFRVGTQQYFHFFASFQLIVIGPSGDNGQHVPSHAEMDIIYEKGQRQQLPKMVARIALAKVFQKNPA